MDRWSNFLDRYGLVKSNGIIAIYFRSVNAILPLKVEFRENEGYEEFTYGPIPISITGYEEGVIPAGQIVEGIKFPYNYLPAEQRDDMFYYTEPNKLIHAKLYFSPIALRIMTEVPLSKKIYSYLGKVTQDLTLDFGWFRGYKEMMFLPKIHVGWDFYNPTNLDLRTNLKIVYGEYRVSLLMDANMIYKVVTRKYPAYWFTYGGKYRFIELDDALKVYGIDSAEDLVPLIPEWFPEDNALNIIREKVNSWRR